MATFRQHIATNVLTVTRFRDLLRKVRSYRPSDDLTSIKKAYEFSQEHHKGQARESGEPYLAHPLQVATILAEMQLDTRLSPPGCCTMPSRTPPSPSTKSRPSSASRSRTSSRASPRSARSTSLRRKRRRPRTCARWCWP